MKLGAYNGTEIEQYGQVSIYHIAHKTKKYRFYMVNRPATLLGLCDSVY